MKKPIVFARMDQDDVNLIKRVCEMRGEDLSNFVRRAIKLELARLSYLSEDEKKALGLRPSVSSLRTHAEDILDDNLAKSNKENTPKGDTNEGE